MTLARRVTRNTLVQVGGEVLGKLATLGLYVAMARVLGAGQFGEFTFALGLAMLLSDFAGMGTDAIVARETARDAASVHSLLWNAIALNGALCGLAVAIAVAVAVAGDYGKRVLLVVVLLALGQAFETIAKTLYATFQGLEDMRPVASTRLAQRLVTAAAGIGALAAGADVVVVAAVYLGGAVLASARAWRRLRARGVRPHRRLSRGHAKRLVLEAVPVGLAGAIGTLLFRADATLLSLIKGNEVVGIYGAAYRLLDATLFFSFYFVASMLPSLSRLDRTSQPTVGQAYEAAAKVLVAVLAPVSAVFVLFAGLLVSVLYGRAYAGAVPVLQLLGLTVVIYPIGYLSGYLLVAQGRQRVTPWISATAAVVNITLNLVLIPRYSLLAAAAITTVSQGLLTLGMTAFARRASGPISLPRTALGPAVGVAAMAAVTWAVGSGAGGLVAALAAYAICLLALERQVYPADVRLLRNALSGRTLPATAPAPIPEP